MPDLTAPIDLVIFDCDGVLIDSEIISARMLISELRGYGVTIDMAYVVTHFLGRSYPVVLDTVRRDFDVDLPDDFGHAYRARLLAAFDRDLRAIPGVHETLERLIVPFCLATSSSPPRLAHSLALVGLDGVFAGRTATASEVAHGKPAPDIFLHVADRMGTHPDRALVIEDSINGIRAAQAAGMRVLRFVGGSHLSGSDLGPEDPEVPRFASFADLPHLVPQVMGAPSMRGAKA